MADLLDLDSQMYNVTDWIDAALDTCHELGEDTDGKWDSLNETIKRLEALKAQAKIVLEPLLPAIKGQKEHEDACDYERI